MAGMGRVRSEAGGGGFVGRYMGIPLEETIVHTLVRGLHADPYHALYSSLTKMRRARPHVLTGPLLPPPGAAVAAAARRPPRPSVPAAFAGAACRALLHASAAASQTAPPSAAAAAAGAVDASQVDRMPDLVGPEDAGACMVGGVAAEHSVAGIHP